MTIYTYEDQKQAHCDIQRLTFKQFNCRSTLKTYCALDQFVTKSQIFTIDSASGWKVRLSSFAAEDARRVGLGRGAANFADISPDDRESTHSCNYQVVQQGWHFAQPGVIPGHARPKSA
jgi:hypothetical protein